MKKHFLIIAGSLGLLLTACSDGSDAISTTTVLADTTTTPVASTVQPPQTSTSTTSPATSTSTTLAGEPLDFGPRNGDELLVIGVAHDDVLNLRTGPGTATSVVGVIPPTATDVIALGATRQLPRSLWIEVQHQGVTGWVNLAFVGYGGVVDDRTSFVVSELGEIPSAGSMIDLGELVATVFVSEDPPSEVVQVTPVSDGDLSEVTYDVIGLGDDAVRGLRLHMFAETTDGEFSLKAVEVTVICGRGVDDEGLCP